MLLNDDVMAEREARPIPSPAGLVVKKGLNILSLTSGGNPRTVIADADLHPVTEIFRRRRKLGHVAVVARLRFALAAA